MKSYREVTIDEISASDLLHEAEQENSSGTRYYRIDMGTPETAQAVYFGTAQLLGIAWGSDADYVDCSGPDDVPAAIRRWEDESR